ncbi:hypothetical protein K402DRAFT_399905 [Aulographum hederae CBS 113979]|uniref:Uncharacterized protein n=1 Tax=Aulographum hederae CBS 113979 TaxID=1176131 RepID=A0A6G1HG11_9PEZI|nr:hypothetical protein K402DRAFT_399905 [Aulographum hederae CBS 113979]
MYLRTGPPPKETTISKLLKRAIASGHLPADATARDMKKSMRKLTPSHIAEAVAADPFPERESPYRVPGDKQFKKVEFVLATRRAAKLTEEEEKEGEEREMDWLCKFEDTEWNCCKWVPHKKLLVYYLNVGRATAAWYRKKRKGAEAGIGKYDLPDGGTLYADDAFFNEAMSEDDDGTSDNIVVGGRIPNLCQSFNEDGEVEDEVMGEDDEDDGML